MLALIRFLDRVQLRRIVQRLDVATILTTPAEAGEMQISVKSKRGFKSKKTMHVVIDSGRAHEEVVEISKEGAEIKVVNMGGLKFPHPAGAAVRLQQTAAAGGGGGDGGGGFFGAQQFLQRTPAISSEHKLLASWTFQHLALFTRNDSTPQGNVLRQLVRLVLEENIATTVRRVQFVLVFLCSCSCSCSCSILVLFLVYVCHIAAPQPDPTLHLTQPFTLDPRQVRDEMLEQCPIFCSEMLVKGVEAQAQIKMAKAADGSRQREELLARSVDAMCEQARRLRTQADFNDFNVSFGDACEQYVLCSRVAPHARACLRASHGRYSLSLRTGSPVPPSLPPSCASSLPRSLARAHRAARSPTAPRASAPHAGTLPLAGTRRLSTSR